MHGTKRLLDIPETDRMPESGRIDVPNRPVAFAWYFIRQVKRPLLIAFILVSISNAAYAVVPYFIKLIVDTLESAETAAAIWPDMGYILAGFIAVPLILSPLFDEMDGAIKYYTMPALQNLMRRQLAYYMHSHSYAYFQDDFSGRLASKVIETPDALRFLVSTLTGNFWYIIVVFVVSCGLFATADWRMLLVILPYGAAYIGWLVWCMPSVMRKSHAAKDEESYVRGRYVDTLSNILPVKLFARRRHEDAYLLDALYRHTTSVRVMNFSIWRTYLGLEIINFVFWIAAVSMALYGWTQDWLSTGDIAMILPTCLTIANQSWWLSDMLAELVTAFGQLQEGMQAITAARPCHDDPAAGPIGDIQGHIAFENMTFGYDEVPFFRDFSLDIPAGRRIGLIGPSGAGKSSLVALLLRLYAPQAGCIRIDGRDIASVKQESLREQIAVIPQSGDLMHRTIAENIRYGRLEASDREVIEAAKQAHAHDFICDLQDNQGNTGYHAYVGERGVKLSGGQRQRIAIARAILKDAPILGLDEATSSLDSESEQAIQESLVHAMEGKTVIAIAHRLSTIAHLDRLIVMDAGRIIEDGTHDELLVNNGLYAKLWQMQSGGFIQA